MATQSNQQPRKRSTNVSLREDLVQEAKMLGLSVSAACEQGLVTALKSKREQRWKDENAEGIRQFNKFVEKHGNPIGHLRAF